MTQPIRSRQHKSALPWWQKRTFTITVALLGLIVVLVVLNINVVKYGTHLATGDTVLLELAPVDPRGFMQGDYMALSYALERNIFDALQPESDNLEQESDIVDQESDAIEAEDDEFELDSRIYEPSEGYVIVKIDNNNVGHFVSLTDSSNRDNLATNEMPIHYRIRNGNVQLATNAFFFQEGHAESFEAAKYGLFRVNDKGEPLLTEMVDEKFEVIVGARNQGDEASN